MTEACAICGVAALFREELRQCCEYHDALVCWSCYWQHREFQDFTDAVGTCIAVLPFASPLSSVEEMAAELRRFIAELVT